MCCFPKENPNIAAAVRATLTAVTAAVPARLFSLSLKRLEITVLIAINIEIIPAYDTGTQKSVYIDGQAEPKSESGSPNPIKER